MLRLFTRQPDAVYSRYYIQRVTGLNAMDVRADLRSLVQYGWVKEHPLQPVKYQANVNHPMFGAVKGFFEAVGY